MIHYRTFIVPPESTHVSYVDERGRSYAPSEFVLLLPVELLGVIGNNIVRSMNMDTHAHRWVNVTHRKNNPMKVSVVVTSCEAQPLFHCLSAEAGDIYLPSPTTSQEVLSGTSSFPRIR